jgi:hypothetical protein
MLPDWNELSNGVQIALAHEALHRASLILAGQAETLADAIEDGSLADHGGAEALRLFAAMLRAEDEDGLTPAGHADDSGAWQGSG